MTLFRAWHESDGLNGEFVYQKSNNIPDVIEFWNSVYHDAVFEPHWGFNDKNGNKMYEGDRVLLFDTVKATCVTFHGCFGYVITGFKKSDFHTFLDNPNFTERDGLLGEVEVIGNIHEHPKT